MTRTLEDMKMVHEEEMLNYGRIQSAVMAVMHRHGCKIIQTPEFEDYDTYSRFFPQLRREMVKTVDTDGQVLVLRPDVTVPLVRTVAREYPDPDQLLKFGYVSTVFRSFYGKSTHGKYFSQSGVEVLGDPTAECDGEVIVMALEFLESVGIHKVRVDLGNVWYMYSLFHELSLSEEELNKVRECLATRNLVSLKQLAAGLELGPKEREVLLAIPGLFGAGEPTFERAEELALNDSMREAVQRLRDTCDYLKACGYGDKIQIDFGFNSHMGYYTDVVFKIYAEGALYSLVSGGRYDSLASRFQVPRPACGFGMNLNLLYEYMAEAGLLEKAGPSCDLAIGYKRADAYLISTLHKWRERGFSVFGFSRVNQIMPDDYRFCVTYEDGKFYLDNKPIGPDELEKKLEAL